MRLTTITILSFNSACEVDACWDWIKKFSSVPIKEFKRNRYSISAKTNEAKQTLVSYYQTN